MESIADFHFLRPLWFLAALPLAYLSYLLWQQRFADTGLEKYISQELLQHLSLGKKTSPSSLPVIALLILWLVTVIALAGPTWKQIPQPLYSSESAVVILLDLSPSMRAEDSKPSRIIRAHLKIQDFLSRRKDGLTALIVYAGEAYTVTPLTDDTKTISNLLPTLKPGILPLPGSNTEMAVSLASQLLTEARLKNASILLITDNIDKSAGTAIQKLLTDSVDLTILGIGTDDGAAIPNNGDFLKDKQGERIIAKRNSDTMEKIAKKVNGYYLPMQNDSSDIDFYYTQLEKRFIDNTEADPEQRKYDRWHEFAPILLLIATPFIALLFRRGLVISLSAILFSFAAISPNMAHANSWWDSLWKNKDQRAAEQYRSEKYDEAAEGFKDPQWKGSAHYKNRDYEAALNAFSKDKSAIGDYNRGNALAQLKRYDEAINAYDQALEKDSRLEQAKKNKETVKKLKKKQEQEKQQNQSSPDSDKKDQQQQQQQQQQDNQGSSQKNKDQESESDQKSQNNNENPENKPPQDKEQAAEKQGIDKEKNDGEGQENQQVEKQNLSPEEQQALEQWLRKVPDDPSGLLKRKFEYEYQKRRQLYQQGKWDLPENDAHQRY